MNENNLLDVYLPEKVRLWIEDTYYKPINERATLEYLAAQDPEFLVQSPAALYSDHGVVHVRDVPALLPVFQSWSNGVLVPRSSSRDRVRWLMRRP